VKKIVDAPKWRQTRCCCDAIYKRGPSRIQLNIPLDLMHIAPSVMDDQLCSPLDTCDRFRFKDMFDALNCQVPSGSTSQHQWHPGSTSEAQIPFTPNTGTPDMWTASLITPIQPLTRIIQHNIPDPVLPLADCSPPSVPMPNPNLYHFYAPPWDEFPIRNYGVAVPVTPFPLDPLLYGPAHLSGEGGFGINQIPQTKGKINIEPLRGSDI